MADITDRTIAEQIACDLLKIYSMRHSTGIKGSISLTRSGVTMCVWDDALGLIAKHHILGQYTRGHFVEFDGLIVKLILD